MAATRSTVPTSPPSPVKKFTRAVLLSSPRGVMLRSFCMEYTKLVNCQFPWRELGHACPLDLLRAMDDVVRVEMARDGSVTLFGIGSESMFMPSWVKKAQGLDKTQTPPIRTAKPSFDHYSVAVLTPSCCNHQSNGQNGARTSEVRNTTRDRSHGSPHNHGDAFHRSHTNAKRSVVEREGGGGLIAEGTRCRTQPGRMSGGSGYTRPHPSIGNVSVQSLRMNTEQQSTWEESHGHSCDQSHGQSCDVSCGQSFQQNSSDQGYPAGPMGAAVSGEGPAIPKSKPERGGVVVGVAGGCVLTSSQQLSSRVRMSELVCAPWTESVVGKEVTWQFSGWGVANGKGLTPVVASEVYSPEKVWLQLTVHAEKDLNEISRGIREANPPQLTSVSEGDVCCIRMPSTSHYRRATVKLLKLHTAPQKQAVVQFIDVGTDHFVVPMTHLHTLPSPFSLSFLPPLALRCRLWGVVSTSSSGHWWELDSQLLRKLVHRKQVYARSWGREEATGSELVDLFLDPDGLQSVAEALVCDGDYMSFSGDQEEEEEEACIEAKVLVPLPQALGAIVGRTLLHSPWQRLQRTLSSADLPPL